MSTENSLRFLFPDRPTSPTFQSIFSNGGMIARKAGPNKTGNRQKESGASLSATKEPKWKRRPSGRRASLVRRGKSLTCPEFYV